MYHHIILEKNAGVATLTLNRPDRLNALHQEMQNELAQAYDEVGNDDEVRVVVLTGAGRAFCAGEDVKVRPAETPDVARRSPRIVLGGGTNERFVIGPRNVPKPVIAAINGPAVGQGLSLALLCDLRLASENARMGAIWGLRGIPPESLGSYALPQIVGLPKALELIFTGRIVGAQEALEIGLVNAVYPADKFAEEIARLARSIARGAPIALALAKRSIYQWADTHIHAAWQFERVIQDYAFHTEDREEGIRSFLEKRDADFKGR